MSINIPESSMERVVILGGGFAGLAVAKKLARLDYQVVLFDKNNYHQFQPLFYQVAMSGLEPSSIVFPLRKILRKFKNVFIRIAQVHEILPDENKVICDFGACKYDHLVIAIGATTNYYGNDNIREKAIPMKSVGEALELRNAILSDLENALTVEEPEEGQKLVDIVIVGGGATGVELAGAIAEMKKYIVPKDYPELQVQEIDVYLVQGEDRLLSGMSEKSSKTSLSYLQALGVKVILNTFVTDYDGDVATLNDGRELTTKKLIWAAGICANTLLGLPEAALTHGKRLSVDPFLKVSGCDNIYAIGDIAYLESKPFPKGHPQVAQVAIQQGNCLAKNFKRLKLEKQWVEFKYKDKGSMATIGRNRAVVDLPQFSFSGFGAWAAWLAVHLFSILGTKNKVFVFLNWVWNYITYDQSLRLIIKRPTKESKREDLS